ncbi:MAG: alpha/beta fold hydrolase [Chitinophagaceae bacterium]
MNKYFSFSNASISYTDTGIGNIVLLIHGFGEDASVWNFQKEFLNQTYRVIIPNLPGSGNSETLLNENISIDDYATCIYSLVEHLKLETTTKIAMFGHSMGGYITLAFAKLFPKKLSAFGLIHSTAFADSEEKKQVRLRGIETIKEYGSYSFLKNTIPNLFANQFKQKHFSVVEKLINKSKIFTNATLQQYYIAMMNRKDTTSVLKNATVPVLFIMGTEDIAAPLNDVLQQCHLPQQSHICVLENVGHMGMLETPNKVNNAIEKILQLLY